MWYVICVLLGVLIGGGGVYFFARQTEIKVIHHTVPDVALLTVVEQLHKVLFMPVGTVVTPFFNAVWCEAGLEEKGVPDITNGRT